MADISSNALAGPDVKKLRRITRACDYCHKRSIRCRFPGQGDHTRCQNCIDFDQPCRFERVVKRRGAKPRTQTSPHFGEALKDEYEDIYRTPSITGPAFSVDWRAPKLVADEIIVDLIEIYFEIVYPTFPFFHQPTFTRRVARGEYVNNKYSYAATMAMCALVTARIVDGAIYNPKWASRKLTEVKSEVFYAAALKECGNVGALVQADFDLLRTCALLAITAIQYGHFREFQTHLGKYHMLVAMDGLHDQDNWPKDIGNVETEERRRLFWSMYHLDILSATMWNGVVRSREQQSNVSYTTELDDELFNDSSYKTDICIDMSSPMLTGMSPTHNTFEAKSSSWLCGWNFMTEVYKLLEHVVTNFRNKKHPRYGFLKDTFREQFTASTSDIEASIMEMYQRLPLCFRETPQITLNPHKDRFGFVAANITATVQLLRMTLSCSTGTSVSDRCKIASEVVASFMHTPVQYLQAISSPLLHQLASIGLTFASCFEESLAESDYSQFRVVLLALAQLIENLDHGAKSSASAKNLRDAISRHDCRMMHHHRNLQIRTQHMAGEAFFQDSDRLAFRAPLERSSTEEGSDRTGSMSHGSGSSSSNNNMIDVATKMQPLAFTIPNDMYHDWHWTSDIMQFPEG